MNDISAPYYTPALKEKVLFYCFSCVCVTMRPFHLSMFPNLFFLSLFSQQVLITAACNLNSLRVGIPYGGIHFCNNFTTTYLGLVYFLYITIESGVSLMSHCSQMLCHGITTKTTKIGTPRTVVFSQ